MFVAVLAVILMHWTTLREKVPPFIMELPSYHFPSPKATAIHLWDKIKHYVEKAATIIVIAALLIWLFTHLSFTQGWIPEAAFEENALEAYHNSVLGQVGYVVSYIFTPVGFGAQTAEGWAYTVATLTGLVAKEVVPGTISVLASGDIEAFVQASGITLGGFFGFISFSLFTIPCFASIGAAKGELKKGTLWKTICFWLGSGYVMGALVYLTVDYVWSLAITLPLIIGAYVLAYFYNKKKTAQERDLEKAKEEIIESL
jgi:ferrous iron transport protein B